MSVQKGVKHIRENSAASTSSNITTSSNENVGVSNGNVDDAEDMEEDEDGVQTSDEEGLDNEDTFVSLSKMKTSQRSDNNNAVMFLKRALLEERILRIKERDKFLHFIKLMETTSKENKEKDEKIEQLLKEKENLLTRLSILQKTSAHGNNTENTGSNSSNSDLNNNNNAPSSSSFNLLSFTSKKAKRTEDQFQLLLRNLTIAQETAMRQEQDIKTKDKELIEIEHKYKVCKKLMNDHEKKCRDAEERVHLLNDEIKKLSQSIKTLQDEKRQLEMDFKVLNVQNQNLQSESSKKDARITELEEICSEKDISIQSLTNKLLKLQQQINEQIIQLKKFHVQKITKNSKVGATIVLQKNPSNGIFTVSVESGGKIQTEQLSTVSDISVDKNDLRKFSIKWLKGSVDTFETDERNDLTKAFRTFMMLLHSK